MPTLVCEHRERNERWIYEFESQPVHIGRSRSAEICIRDLGVSKDHACIEQRNGRYRFRDLGSKNGTFINELKSDGGPLYDGDQLRVGNVVISFYRDKPPERLAADSPPDGSAPQGDGNDGTVFSKETLITAVPDEPAPGRETADKPPRVDAPQPGAQRDEAATPHPSRRPPGVSPPRKVLRVERVAQVRIPANGPDPERLVVYLVAGVALVAVGFWIGRATAPESGAKRDREETAEREVPAPAKADGPEEPSDGAGTPPGERQAPPAPPAPSPSGTVALITGPRADLGDPATSRRALYRLFLDLAGRSPTRAEFAKFLPLSHEERWDELIALVRDDPLAPHPTAVADMFEAFLGRAGRPDEVRELVHMASSDAERLGRILSSSRLYSEPQHRRRRSIEQRVRSFWSDLLDHMPTAENAETVSKALEEENGEPTEVLRTMVYSKSARIGPADRKMEGRVWVRESYMRFLLRYPLAEEEGAALEKLGQENGWRLVILELALRPEYQEY